MTTPDQIIKAAQTEAERTIDVAESIIIRDIDRVTTGQWADPTLTPVWRAMSSGEQRQQAHAVLMHAYATQTDDRHDDAIPRALRVLVRILARSTRQN